ncbi:MAG: hypothetical protein J6D06_06425 [Clostridia bacterium]|nr:hypothetical protein [Clostridia bacterium]
MKKGIIVILGVILAVIIGGLGVFSPYILSFVVTDSEFVIGKDNEDTAIAITSSYKTFNDDGSINLEKAVNCTFDDSKFKMFNYYGLKYTTDAYVKGTLTYKAGTKEVSEDFFLEPTNTEKEFNSFIDDFLDGKKAYKLISLSFEALNKEDAKMDILGFSVFNREIPDREVFVESDNLKIGVDLLWGGALSYVEDLNSNVQAVSVDGQIKVDSNAEERYNAKSVNDNVNLINRNDTGRLVQQSYYGTLDYDHGVYMENDWKYNPVQGGNQFNDASKIVDLKITGNSIYIKCRPLDWAKEKEFITPSYMEATYSIENGAVHGKCRFVDFSGYPEAESTQEIPAFYCIEPFNNFVYYKGDKPWTNGPLTNEPELIFWPDAGYPKFYNKENWAAFTGEFEDSFGIGIYVEGEEEFLSGVFEREKTTEEDPSKAGPTSYIAITKTRIFTSFEPFRYEYYLATGNANEIRETFKKIANS